MRVWYSEEAWNWTEEQPPDKRAYVRRSVKELEQIPGLAEKCMPVANPCLKHRRFGPARCFKLYAFPPGQRVLFWFVRKFGLCLVFRIRDRDDNPYTDGG